jgi:hypothetical protein
MPRDSARVLQLPLFVHDTVGYPDALARYEGVYATAWPCNRKELGRRRRYIDVVTVGCTRPVRHWCFMPVYEVGPGSSWRHQW